ncbi:hypothetical protein BHU62_01675 [Serratia marcescens]|uniref:Uncharacterized protein n=1 Tax=Serratia marcescens TaxID=615 RepID=A0A1Q4P6T4_SERMA|nr:hypothetical protein BHU62_01675 [Serratia marcescens]
MGGFFKKAIDKLKRFTALAVGIGNFPFPHPMPKEHGLTSNLRRQSAYGIDVIFFHYQDQIILTTHRGS